MGWESINWNLLHAMDFSLEAENLILRVFDSSTNALDEEWKKYSADFKTNQGKPLEEWEADAMSQEMYWEEDLHRQRKQGVGALALDWLMCSLQTALHGAKNYLDSTHPPKPPYYKKKGWLGEVTDEYQQRFKIDFGKAPVSFERLQELVLARNAGIHRNQGNLDTYLKQIGKPAFVDDEDRFFVTKDALIRMMQDCEHFIKWVVTEIEKLRPAKVPSK